MPKFDLSLDCVRSRHWKPKWQHSKMTIINVNKQQSNQNDKQPKGKFYISNQTRVKQHRKYETVSKYQLLFINVHTTQPVLAAFFNYKNLFILDYFVFLICNNLQQGQVRKSFHMKEMQMKYFQSNIQVLSINRYRFKPKMYQYILGCRLWFQVITFLHSHASNAKCTLIVHHELNTLRPITYHR